MWNFQSAGIFPSTSLRATAATNALDHEADITRVQGLAWALQHQYNEAI